MIELKQQRLLVDGQPQLILAGEIHYFRLPRNEWADRLSKLKSAGCDTLSSYIPWICHEPLEGQLDFTGRTRPELDIGAFIDLAKEFGLGFIARPGPFTMAEMKNEGLPYWLYQKHPEIIPLGWDGAKATTPTVDYLSPSFLEEAKRWYDHILAIISPRLQSKGGNVIALQLDNEIGMLSWVTNIPDLTEVTLEDLARWLKARYSPDDLKARYPFDLDQPQERGKAFRSPKESYAAALFRDLGHYQRDRYARYVSTLRGYAEAAGVIGIPFLVNVHGTGGGRGFGFPIGISQLLETWQAPDTLVGSDLYLGNLTADNFQDLFLCNAYLKATLGDRQLLCSAEFECGDGDYGSVQGNRYDPSAVDLKTRMSIAQGNRLLNYYLFAGGINTPLAPPPGDGDDLIATNGERHGNAAPIKWDGTFNYTWPRMVRVIRTMAAWGPRLAEMDEEHDPVRLGFIPDYFMTEARYPQSAGMREIAVNLEGHRMYGAWECFIRAILLANYRFPAIDLQKKVISPETDPVIALPSARYMDPMVQEKLGRFVQAGGRLLLYGEVPLFDMEGRTCTTLADLLGLRILESLRGSEKVFLSLYADSWAAPRPKVRTHEAQILEAPGSSVLFRLHGGGEPVAVDLKAGQGRAIVVATALACDIPFYQEALIRLGATAGLQQDSGDTGLFMTSTINPKGERLIHVLNLDGYEKRFRIRLNGRRIQGGASITLQGRDGLMLPHGLHIGAVKVIYSTAEMINIDEGGFTLRSPAPHGALLLKGARGARGSGPVQIWQRGDLTHIRLEGPVEALRIDLL